MKHVSTIVATLVLLTTASSGCLENGFFGNENSEPSLASPTWEKGDFWEYSITVDDKQFSTTMVVSVDDDDSDYYIGAGSLSSGSGLDDAKRHAVLNYNPALGRVQMADYAIYENNIPQKITDFPLEQDKSWEFSLYGENFKASVIDITESVAEMNANANSGAFIKYTFDKNARWLDNFEYTNSNGEVELVMNLANYGSGYTGNSYFCRGGDLFDEEFIGPDFGVYDTVFANEGHERYGPWNYIVYYLEADIGSSGSGELVLRDHEGTEVLLETFSPGTNQHIMGTVAGSSGNWTLEISLSGNADVRARIAGAIQYTYSV
ncbi:MAG: hypothetical protein BEU01_01390 [Marine Group III euryarchaeote CG-Epi4]|uniref:Uncharacterized protein n=1 Tax=Marine Group III euryarchaeote CG-Epi4 TaxID=1888998 RepID=A0A1J5TI94_9ARCH|nr:MAG: hypothetical protein BEU01_01390 [Marine Group III euryarchaeote CG-Epi4]|tara:strand:- start:957 stop:1916 length:960 start_codon:yes stop_codon:yes gene_type:complete